MKLSHISFHFNDDAEQKLPKTREELEALIDQRIREALEQFVDAVGRKLSEPHAPPVA